MEPVNYKKYHPVITISRKGKLLVGTVRLLYRVRQWFAKDKWESVLATHHEDPLTMTTAEKLYLGHKYYYRAMIVPEKDSGLKEYFSKQDLQFKTPEGFIPAATIAVSAGGDLIPYTCIQPAVCKDLWKHVGDFFFDADIVFANLETPADLDQPYSAAPEVMLHDMYFNADAATLKIFEGNGDFKGYDVVSIANNHSLDSGVEGLKNTMRWLQNKGIEYCGAALRKEEQHQFPLIEREGIRIAFVAASFSFNKELLPESSAWLCNHIELNLPNPDIQLLQTQARIARERGADLVVAALHMGCAYQAFPGNSTVNNIHQICDQAGIDLVLAGHPHHAQPMEIYESAISGKKHLIVYSLGDFIAYDIFKWGHLTMMLKIQISKGSLNGESYTGITGIQVKPAYMHAVKEKGHITKLTLLDYVTVKANPTAFFSKKKDRKKFEEVSDFFENFVLLPHQRHVII